MTSSIPYLTAENEKANHIVHLLMVNNNHFNTLNVKIYANFHFSKRWKIDYKKCEPIVKTRKRPQFYVRLFNSLF